MSSLISVQELSRRGRFAEAFRVLEQLTLPLDERLMADSLRVELLERTGRYVESKALAEQLLRSPRCLASQRCASFMALGYSAFEHGFIEAATNHFQKALSAAEAAGDLRAVCACQLRLMNLLADRSGHQVVAPLLAQVRRNVTKVGDASTTAALHIGIAELEAKRGLTSTASRHVALAKNLLRASENIYLEGVAENIATAISIMRSEPFKGIEHGERAAVLATDSGCTSLKRATLGNLGNLHLLTGRFDVARQYFAAARAVFPATGALSNGALESLAVLSLAEGRLTEANELLNEIKDSVKTQADWMIYANRHSRLTLAEVMARSGRLRDALEEIERVLELAHRSGDRYLHMNASLIKAEVLIATARIDDALTIFSDTAPLLPEYPPDTYARHQRGMAFAFLSVDQIVPALRSLERSKRTYQGLNNVHGELELTRAWAERRRPDMNVTPGTQKPEDILQSVAALMLHAGHPKLIAGDLVEVLADTNGVVSATAVSLGVDGAMERIAMCGDLDSTHNDVFR